MSPEAKSYFTPQTMVPVGLLVAVLLTAVGGTWQLGRTMGEFREDLVGRDHAMDLRFQRLEIKIEQLERTVSDTASDRWTITNMRSWVDSFKVRNPQIVVPDIK